MTKDFIVTRLWLIICLILAWTKGFEPALASGVLAISPGHLNIQFISAKKKKSWTKKDLKGFKKSCKLFARFFLKGKGAFGYGIASTYDCLAGNKVISGGKVRHKPLWSIVIKDNRKENKPVIIELRFHPGGGGEAVGSRAGWASWFEKDH